MRWCGYGRALLLMCLTSPPYAPRPLTPEHTASNRTLESSATVSTTPVSARCVTSGPAPTVMSNLIVTVVLQRPASTTTLCQLWPSLRPEDLAFYTFAICRRKTCTVQTGVENC